MPVIRYFTQNTSTERQQTVNDVQAWLNSQLKRSVYGVEATNPAGVALVKELSGPRLN